MGILRLRKNLDNVSNEELIAAIENEIDEMREQLTNEYHKRSYDIWAPKVGIDAWLEYETPQRKGAGRVVCVKESGAQIEEEGFQRRKLIRWHRIKNVTNMEHSDTSDAKEDELTWDRADMVDAEEDTAL